jgi:hypothetical protein
MTSNAAQNNPFAYWQNTMNHWMPASCQQPPQSAMVEPFTMVNPMTAFNPMQMMQMWQNFFQPQPTAQKPQWPFPFPMPMQMQSPNMMSAMGDWKPMYDMMLQWQQMCMKQMMQMGGNR